ncbi:MAG: Oxidoreductase [Peltula sp. TS41687]|nr:MAG: Oxidoreductase [Peltula sp. TS41687]
MMFRTPARLLPHRPFILSPPRIRSPAHGSRALSFARPARRSRSWKNTAVRWALAFGTVYIYNTSNVFAEVPAQHVVPGPSDPHDESPLPTLDDVVAKRQKSSESQDFSDAPDATALIAQGAETESRPATPQEYEEEAANEGAFNPETGEINWDCPCLGGMAHGPCGEEFKAAFGCFVHSTVEPKGMDCIEHFKGMQNCFRRYPEVYAAELDDDEEEEQGHEQSQAAKGDDMPTKISPETSSAPSNAPIPPPKPVQTQDGEEAGQGTDTRTPLTSNSPDSTDPKTEPRETLPQPTQPHPESGDRGLAPKAWHDEKRDEGSK